MKLIETIDTKISDKWGVMWSQTEYLRDFYQNFYDANKKQDIKIATNDQGLIEFSSPAAFDWQELVILGSDKGEQENMIGQYGEGFKASLVNAMRDNVKVSISIEPNLFLKFYYKVQTVNNRDRNVIFCDRFENDKTHKGTTLHLENSSTELIEISKHIDNHFFSPDNGPIGKLWGVETGMEVYNSNLEEGYIYYNNLLRGEIDIPFHVVFTKKYQDIEKQIMHDRDRKSFDDKVLTKAINIFAKKFTHLLLSHKHLLHTKSKVVNAIARHIRFEYDMKLMAQFYKNQGIMDDFNLSENKIIPSFMRFMTFSGDEGLIQEFIDYKDEVAPDNFSYGPSLHTPLVDDFDIDEDFINFYKLSYVLGESYRKNYLGPDKLARYNHYMHMLSQCKLTKVSSSFNGWCLISPFMLIEFENIMISHAADNSNKDLLSKHKTKVDILKRTVHDIFNYHGYSSKLNMKYNLDIPLNIIEDNNEVGGVYKGGKVISLSEGLFKKGSLSDAMAIYIHELSHQFGSDGTRQFGDALTYCISVVAEGYEWISIYKHFWDNNIPYVKSVFNNVRIDLLEHQNKSRENIKKLLGNA